jgi:hypothetical protein
MHAQAILLVQPSVFQEIRAGKGVETEDEGVKYWKDVEEGLRGWIESEDCQRDASDVYFNDGIQRKGMLHSP